MGLVGRAGRCPGCSGTLLGAPSPTPVAPGPRSASSSGLHVFLLHLSTQAGQSVLDCQRINRTPKASTAGRWRGVPNESQKGDLAGIARHTREGPAWLGEGLWL